MIISVNWLKNFVPINGTIDELAALIGERLVEIESVEDLGKKYRDVIIAQVAECSPLENSDHLNVVLIDDGGVAEGIERNEAGLVQVVCGAPNVRVGMQVAWLPPKSIVPETFNDSEPFVLAAKPLRGVMSNGMLASAKELDLYDEHDGILEVDADVAPGTSFAEVYELNDYLLDIENKSLTHRPDAFGVIGFAREVAGIQGLPFQNPEWLSHLSSAISIESGEQVGVEIQDASLSDRFQAIVLSGVDEKAKSPILMQTYLARSGVRPISASVDISNYLMLLTGQPSHTYDYDKLKMVANGDATIRVRTARNGETLTLLDGKTIELDTSDIVIAAGETAVGLAGIMGGESTKVDDATRSVVLEVATFDLYHMRSTQMRHGIFSEAVTRFTKGIPAPLGTPVLDEAVRLLELHTGAHIQGPLTDTYLGKREPIVVEVTTSHINDTLGTYHTAADVSDILENVGFDVTFEGEKATVLVPYWREDIHIAEDLIEEVGRLSGFDTIAVTMPGRTFAPVRPTDFDELRTILRKRLVRAGANELLTYSFVHGDLFAKVGQKAENAYRIVNSLSPDLQYYRQSLTPSLLTHVFPNIKTGFDSFALFECNKIHAKHDGVNEESVPVETDRIALVLANAKQDGDAYFEVKHYLEYLTRVLGVSLQYEPLEGESPTSAPFEPKRSARVIDATSGKEIGIIGEYRRAVQKAFKLPPYSAGFELEPRQLLAAIEGVKVPYEPLSRYPGVERDITFQVDDDVSYEAVLVAAENALSDVSLAAKVWPLGIYKAEGGTEKNITLRYSFRSHDKTLTSEEVNEIVNKIGESVVQATGGKIL